MTETLMHIEIDEHMDVSLINCYNLQDISYIFEMKIYAKHFNIENYLLKTVQSVIKKQV